MTAAEPVDGLGKEDCGTGQGAGSAAVPTKLLRSYGNPTSRDLQGTCEWLTRCLQTKPELAAGADAALAALRTVIDDVVRVR